MHTLAIGTIMLFVTGLMFINTLHSNIIYGQMDFGNNKQAEDLAMALLQDRKAGFEDGTGPNFEETLSEMEGDMGFDFSDPIRESFLIGAQQYLIYLEK